MRDLYHNIEVNTILDPTTVKADAAFSAAEKRPCADTLKQVTARRQKRKPPAYAGGFFLTPASELSRATMLF